MSNSTEVPRILFVGLPGTWCTATSGPGTEPERARDSFCDAKREAADAKLAAEEAEARAKAAASESKKLERLRVTAAEVVTRLAAEERQREGLKMRKATDAALVEMLGDPETKGMADDEIRRRTRLRVAERMRESTLHKLCVARSPWRKASTKGAPPARLINLQPCQRMVPR
jgi:hypothetical protein